jgi:hypothetical protein
MIDGWLALPVLAAVLIVVGKLLPGRESGGNASSE